MVGQGNKAVKVCVHLDLEEEPSYEEIASELVRYILVFENINSKSKGVNHVKRIS